MTTGTLRNFNFNFIYIVESLSPDELKTGSYLHLLSIEGIVSELSRSGIVVGAEVVEVPTTSSLLAFLDRTRAEVEAGARMPVLHFEIHGSTDQQGLVLSSGEFVAWEALLEPLTRINRAMRNNLLVTLAVCSGAYLGSILNPAKPAPFWGLLGPDKIAFPLVLFRGFTAFYETFLREFDGTKALRALRAAARAADSEASYAFMNAEYMFARAFRRYVDEMCNPDARRERLVAFVANARRQAAQRSEAVNEVALLIAADQYLRHMADPRSAFEKLRRRYFMIDEWPENDRRFPVTFDDIMKG